MQTESTTDHAAVAAANVITPGDAAARICPEEGCGALMEVTHPDGSDPNETEDKPYLRCPDCEHCVPIAAAPADEAASGDEAAPAIDAKQMSCETCGLVIFASRLPSGHGFKIIAIERGGDHRIAHDSTFGVSPNGFPLCPVDNVALIPVGQTPVAEAFPAIADALEPRQQTIPGILPPFDFAQALLSIARKNRDVESAREEYEDRKARASDAKKRLDALTEQLSLLIAELDRRRQEMEDRARGRLRPGQVSPCVTEQQTGMPCVICAEARKKAAAAATDQAPAPLNLVSLREHLRHRGYFFVLTELVDIANREDTQLLAALMNIAEGTPLEPAMPDVSAAAHIAGPYSPEGGQHCTRCGMVLHNASDEAAGQVAYPEGAYVGLDCEEAPNGPAAGPEAVDEKAEAPEPARQTARRHADPKKAAAAKTKATRAARQKKGGGK